MGNLESFNPATGELLGSVATVDPGDVQAAVDEVAAVQPFWGELSLPDRGRYLRRTTSIVWASVIGLPCSLVSSRVTSSRSPARISAVRRR